MLLAQVGPEIPEVAIERQPVRQNNELEVLGPPAHRLSDRMVQSPPGDSFRNRHFQGVELFAPLPVVNDGLVIAKEWLIIGGLTDSAEYGSVLLACSASGGSFLQDSL